jgi:hypothetical protein
MPLSHLLRFWPLISLPVKRLINKCSTEPRPLHHEYFLSFVMVYLLRENFCSACFVSFCVFETGSCSILQVCLNLTMLPRLAVLGFELKSLDLDPPTYASQVLGLQMGGTASGPASASWCWDYRHLPPYLAFLGRNFTETMHAYIWYGCAYVWTQNINRFYVRIYVYINKCKFIHVFIIYIYVRFCMRMSTINKIMLQS